MNHQRSHLNFDKESEAATRLAAASFFTTNRTNGANLTNYSYYLSIRVIRDS
ncbi:hypothetical protein MNBD_CHLOROFLEXI01-3639 [hydrothermal vent metagenome]|uniref:Uncharacterized protein n=1 Tax=hydrothermal vent metagenome TaxID=652676 RepID=A0A3B0UYM4_9ZZZZ